MKRVRVLAGLVPTVVGFSAPLVAAPAPPATASPTARQKSVSTVPLDSGKACDREVCVEVFGHGNWVSKVTEWVTHTTRQPDVFYLQVKAVHRGSGTWKSATIGSFVGTKSHTWKPACSWSGSRFSPTDVSAYAVRGPGFPFVSVHGTSYTGAHKCGFL